MLWPVVVSSIAFFLGAGVSGCASTWLTKSIDTANGLAAETQVADATSSSDTNTPAPVTAAKPEQTAAPDSTVEPTWLSSAQWLDDTEYDAARLALPLGLQDSAPKYVWHYRPVNLPEEIDWTEVASVASTDEPGSENAAVLLARHRRSGEDIDRMQELVRSASRRPVESMPNLEKLPSQSRLFNNGSQRNKNPIVRTHVRLSAAALEAWSVILADSETASSDRSESAWAELLDAAGESLRDEVRSELYRSIGRGVAPTRIPAIAEWLASDETGTWPRGLRRAVLDGCLHYATLHADDIELLDVEALTRLQYDPDSGVRLRLGRLVAVTRPENAIEILKTQTHDRTSEVRNGAWLNLGIHGGSDASKLLKTAIESPSEQVRAATVLAMSLIDEQQVIGTDDESAYVRQAAAKSLASRPQPTNLQKLTTLVQDPDRLVQQAAVDAVQHWPDALTLPLLTEAIVVSSVTVRQAALAELRRRTRIEEMFIVEASRDDREAKINEWRTRFRLPTAPVVEPEPIVIADSNTLRIALLKLDADPASPAAWSTLESITVHDLPALTELLEARQRNRQNTEWEPLWNSILPALRDDFEALRLLRSADVPERLQGAALLAQYAAKQLPSSLVTGQLPGLMATEQNSVVWRDVLGMAGANGGLVLDQLVPLALNSPWPDVRQMACEAIEQHSKPDYARWLRPVLYDGDIGVRRAAVRAAGACGNPSLIDGPNGGLRALLASSSPAIRLESATAMARLGDTSGMQILLGMAHNPDVTKRREVVNNLALAAGHEYADPILTLAFSERDDISRARYLEILEQLNPEAAMWSSESDYTRKLEVWSAGQWPARVAPKAE